MHKQNPNCHNGHRRRMRQRYKTTGLEGFAPHEVLELLLFDFLPRVNTNPLAHTMLFQRKSLTEVLTDPPLVPGVGSQTRDGLLQVQAELTEHMHEILVNAPKVGANQLFILGIWQLRRTPDKVLLLVTDENHAFCSLHLPDRDSIEDTLPGFLAALKPGQVCHLAVQVEKTGKRKWHPEKWAEDERMANVLLFSRTWQCIWVLQEANAEEKPVKEEDRYVLLPY